MLAEDRIGLICALLSKSLWPYSFVFGRSGINRDQVLAGTNRSDG